MRRLGTTLAAVVLAGAGLVGTAGAAGAATTSAAACGTGWGSGEKNHKPSDYKTLGDIRTGQHACYDRMVFDVKGAEDGAIGYRVGYVDTMYQDGSGEPIAVGGGAVLEIHAGAPSHAPSGEGASYPGKAGKPLPGVDIDGYKTFQDTRFGASFEGDTQVGVGVRAKLPFRVYQSGEHLIVDVAHSWNGAAAQR